MWYLHCTSRRLKAGRDQCAVQSLCSHIDFWGFVRFGSRTWDWEVIWGSCKRQIHHKPTQNLRARQDPVQVLMERNRQIHLLPGTCDQERDPTGNFVCIGLLQFEVSSPDKSCNCWRSLANVWLLQSLGSSHVKVCLQERRSYEAAPRSFCKVALTSCNPTEQRPKKTKTLKTLHKRFGCLEANSIESYLVVPCWFFDLPGSVWLELVISIEPLPRKEVRTKCNQTVRRQGLGSSDCPLTGLARKARRYPKKQTGITGRQLIRETVKRLGIPWVSFQVLKSPNPHSKVLKSHPSGDTGWKNSSLWPDKNRADLGIWDFSGNSFAGFTIFMIGVSCISRTSPENQRTSLQTQKKFRSHVGVTIGRSLSHL